MSMSSISEAEALEFVRGLNNTEKENFRTLLQVLTRHSQRKGALMFSALVSVAEELYTNEMEECV